MTGDIAKDWYKSSFSINEPSCVGARIHADGTVDLRNTNNPEGPMLTFTRPEWLAFVQGVEAGEFNLD
jgi:hypothetical protein